MNLSWFPGHLPEDGKSLILMAFHYLAFALPFVVDTAEMEKAVDDNTMKLCQIIRSKLFRIGPDGVERYIHIPGYGIACGIVECYDIREIVVTQRTYVDTQYFGVVDKDIVEPTDSEAVTPCHLDEPRPCPVDIDGRERQNLGNPVDFHNKLQN